MALQNESNNFCTQQILRFESIFKEFDVFQKQDYDCAADLNVLGTNEPRREKTGLRGFRPGPTQTGLYSLRSRLEA